MAFSAKQTKNTQIAVIVVLLVIAVVLLVAVLSGTFAPKGTASTGAATASAGSASTSTATGSTSATGTSTGSTSSTGAASSSSSTGSSSSNLSTMEQVDATYGAAEKQLQAQYDADNTNASALLNLANGYFDWGVAAQNVAKSDSDKTHVKELFNKAIANYDTYLKGNSTAKSVQVDRAICIFYVGDVTKAIQTLEDFTKADATFGPAWANLGMFYENAGRTDDAKAAYQKAIDTDPNDTYQVKTYAQQHLDALNKQ